MAIDYSNTTRPNSKLRTRFKYIRRKYINNFLIANIILLYQSQCLLLAHIHQFVVCGLIETPVNSTEVQNEA